MRGCGHLHRGCAVGHAAKGQGKIPVPVVQLDPDGGEISPSCANANGIDDLHGGDVQAVLQRCTEGHVAIIGAAGVLGFVAAKGSGFIQNDGGGGPSGIFHGRGENSQRLEGAARLSAQVRGAVETTAGLVFPSADNGTDCP